MLLSITLIIQLQVVAPFRYTIRPYFLPPPQKNHLFNFFVHRVSSEMHQSTTNLPLFLFCLVKQRLLKRELNIQIAIEILLSLGLRKFLFWNGFFSFLFLFLFFSLAPFSLSLCSLFVFSLLQFSRAVRLGESSVGKKEYEYIRLDENKVSISYEDGQVLYGLGMDFTQKANVFLPREGNWFFFLFFFFFFIQSYYFKDLPLISLFPSVLFNTPTPLVSF